ncbi:hypothetical protein P4118_16930 [Pseudomonas aeruginosa]|nr:hypothetical protein [Pseudomonas aeruginosa]
MAILFGDGRSKHGEAHRLFREEVFPVCSPRLVEGLQLPLAKAHLARLPMLHLKPAQHARWFDWPALFERWPSIGSRFRRCSASTTTPC